MVHALGAEDMSRTEMVDDAVRRAYEKFRIELPVRGCTCSSCAANQVNLVGPFAYRVRREFKALADMNDAQRGGMRS